MKPATLPLLRRPLHATRVLLAALLGTVLAACGNGFGSRPTPPPDEVERIGALELVTHFRAERGGDAARFAWQHVAHWSLRWQGQPLVIDTLGGLFGDQPMQLTRINAVFVLERGPGMPQLLVNVGDPNNTSAFHLVRQQGDALDVRLLCIVSGGSNGVGWAQHVLRHGDTEHIAAGLPGQTQWHLGPVRETLQVGSSLQAGGRYLQLGHRCLFDTATDAVLWMADGGHAMNWGPAMVSPEGTRIARLGPIDGGDGIRRGQATLVSTRLAQLPAGVVPGSVAAHRAVDKTDAWQQIALPRERMRYPSAREIDTGWVLHHFRWARDAASGLKDDVKDERLVERTGFRPLPHRGLFNEVQAEYKLEGLRESQRQHFVDFLVARFAGQVVTNGADTYSVKLRLPTPEGEHLLNVHDAGFYIAGGGPYHPGAANDPQMQRALMRRLSQAFDGELASGRLDHWFTANGTPR